MAGKRAGGCPLNEDVASEFSTEENTIQVAECLDDEIRAPLAARINAEYSIFKAADSVVLALRNMTS